MESGSKRSYAEFSDQNESLKMNAQSCVMLCFVAPCWSMGSPEVEELGMPFEIWHCKSRDM